MGVMTLLSRVFGYVRDLLLAAILGAAGSSDAFIIALRIPSLLRRLVGEGAMTAAFVPVFARQLRDAPPREAERFAGRAFGTLALLLGLLTLAGVLLSPLIVRGVAWGFLDSAGKWELTVSLNRLMFPYLFFIGLAALAMAILNSLGSFAVPAFTPVLLNLSIILSALLVAPHLEEPAYAFAGGVLLGGFLQLVFQLPFLRARGIRIRPRLGLQDPAVRRVGMLMVPGFVGVGVYQINLIVDAQFASFLADGSVSWLYYGDRITELVLGVFAISLSTVVLPTLSRHFAEGDAGKVAETLSGALRLVAFIAVPATVGLVLLRDPIVQVLFQRGEFGPEDTVQTGWALLGYGVGLLPFSAVKMLAPAFYAQEDTRTPVKVAAACLGFHVAVCALLIGPLGHTGIALATSLASTLNMLLLTWILARRIGMAFLLGVPTGLLRFGVAGGIMALALRALGRLHPFPVTGAQAQGAAWLAIAIAVGVATYSLSSLALGGREIRELGAVLPWRRP
jgi:putative peptidoglycan lipid II flippase